MCGLTFTITPGSDVTQEQLEACADLFSKYYGVWGSKAQETSRFLKEGTRVKLSPSKLAEQCLGSPAATLLVTCHEGKILVGHAFATTWEYEEGGGTVCWVTQLVVRSDHRRQGIATTLLGYLRHHNPTALGIASSHPAACLSLCKAAGVSIQHVDLDFIRSHTPLMLGTTPVDYLKSAQPRGTLFEGENPIDDPSTTTISSLFTRFYVDHDEPLEVLKGYKDVVWPLGDLIEGHEFLLLVRK